MLKINQNLITERFIGPNYNFVIFIVTEIKIFGVKFYSSKKFLREA